MKTIKLLLPICVVTPALLLAQSRGLDPAAQLRPPADSWPTYSGDLTGRRYSPLKHIDKTNVKQLSLAWVVAGIHRRLRCQPAGARPSGSGRRWRRWRTRRRRRISDRRQRTRVRRVQHWRARGHPRIGSDGRRRAVPDVAGQRLGGGRARRLDPLAVLLEDARRHSHRPSRRRDVAELHLHRVPRQLPREARRANGQGTVARRDLAVRRAVFLVDGADHHRRPRHRGHGQRPRHARLPAVVRR